MNETRNRKLRVKNGLLSWHPMDVLGTCLWRHGDVTRRTIKTTRCDDSKRALIMKRGFHEIPEVELINCKIRGKVFCLSATILKIPKAADAESAENTEHKFLCDKTIDHILQRDIFIFPSSWHRGCVCFKTLYYTCQSANAAPPNKIFWSSEFVSPCDCYFARNSK